MCDEERLKIQMLGGFTLSYGKKTVREEDSRSRKMWLLLARLIYCRGKNIPQDELIQLLWDDEPEIVNPYSALKTTLHRLRSQLAVLEVPDHLILRKNGTYIWNNEISMECDTAQFEQFCALARSEKDSEKKLQASLQALEIYQGDFLPRLSMEPWVVPISAYFHNKYLETVETALVLLEKRGHFQEMISITKNALQLEPYSEELHVHLIRGYISTNQRDAAVSAYESLCHLLMDNFGVIPSEETRKLYHSLLGSESGYAMPLDSIRQQLQEETPLPGPLFCEYEVFRMIYHTLARMISRTGEPIHIAILTVKGAEGKSLSSRSHNLAMRNLQSQILSCIRSGDVATKCSSSQFILLLPRANYENSCLVCARIIRAFFRKHPHSPADISYMVQAMEPSSTVLPRDRA